MVPIDLHKICSLLGLESSQFSSMEQLVAFADGGLDFHCVQSLESFFNGTGYLSEKNLSDAIGESSSDFPMRRLTPETSSKLLNLATVAALASYVWSSDRLAAEFLTKPHQLLDGQRPIDLVLDGTSSSLGNITKVLTNLFYGVYS